MKKTKKVTKTNKVVALALEPQLRIWHSKDGRQTRMCDMSDTHVMHSLYLLKRNAMKALIEFINNNNRKAKPQNVLSVHDEIMITTPRQLEQGLEQLTGMKWAAVDPDGNRIKDKPQPTLEEAYAKKDVATGMTWRDFTDAYFYPLLLEAYRRLGLTTYINEMLTTDKLRFAQ